VIEGGGGVDNGSTRDDDTNYIVSAPTSALDAILWLEAERMKQLDFSEKEPQEPAGGREGRDPAPYPRCFPAERGAQAVTGGRP
jgi:hypothetical protein